MRDGEKGKSTAYVTPGTGSSRKCIDGLVLGTPPSPIPTGQRLRFTLWLAVEVMMQSSREETYGSLLPANCPGRTG